MFETLFESKYFALFLYNCVFVTLVAVALQFVYSKWYDVLLLLVTAGKILAAAAAAAAAAATTTTTKKIPGSFGTCSSVHMSDLLPLNIQS